MTIFMYALKAAESRRQYPQRFKMSLKSKEVQRQYSNLLERFLNFCKFEGLDIEQKAIKFCDFVKFKYQEEVEDLIIRFIPINNMIQTLLSLASKSNQRYSINNYILIMILIKK